MHLCLPCVFIISVFSIVCCILSSTFLPTACECLLRSMLSKQADKRPFTRDLFHHHWFTAQIPGNPPPPVVPRSCFDAVSHFCSSSSAAAAGDQDGAGVTEQSCRKIAVSSLPEMGPFACCDNQSKRPNSQHPPSYETIQAIPTTDLAADMDVSCVCVCASALSWVRANPSIQALGVQQRILLIAECGARIVPA